MGDGGTDQALLPERGSEVVLPDPSNCLPFSAAKH
jgi:hypothetical protein